jgi:hypothetical protein
MLSKVPFVDCVSRHSSCLRLPTVKARIADAGMEGADEWRKLEEEPWIALCERFGVDYGSPAGQQTH